MVDNIRRAIAAALISGAAVASAQGADRENALRFERNARAVVESFTPARAQVRQGKSGGFTRIEWTLVDPAVVDVKRTDSLIEPVLAMVELKAKLAGSSPAATPDEAAQNPVTPIDEFRIQATFAPAGSGWTFKSGRFMSKQLGKWLELKPEALRAQPMSPIAELAKLFEVQ